MKLRTLLATASLALSLFACTDGRMPSGPDPATASTATLSVAAAAGSMAPSGIRGFHFAAPIGTDATLPSARDETLLDLLSIEICEWNGTACASAPIQRFDANGTGPGRLRLDDGIYKVVWNSDIATSDPEKSYRIRVMATGGEVGHVGLRLRARGSQKSSDAHGAVEIVQGASLPIAFVIEPGAGVRATTGAARLVLADGAVTLDLPADALADDRYLTAARVDETSLPTGRPIVPGTAWDLGPDGLLFAKPATLTIRFDLAQVPSGINAAELRIHKLVGGEYVQQRAGRVNLADGTISAEVDGFSIFVVIPRDIRNTQDREAPVVVTLGVRAGGVPTFSNVIELGVGTSNAPYTFRLGLTDDVAGVSFIDLRYISPTARQVRFTCYTNAAPNSGSDTNGEWDCNAEMPRFAESGDWTPQLLQIYDRVNNVLTLQRRAAGFCNSSNTVCIASPPVIRVAPSVNDIDAPVLTSLRVSRSVEPRSFTDALVVPSSATAQRLIFGFAAQDNLAGVGNGLFFDVFAARLRSPVGGQSVFLYPSCSLRTGTSVTGFWECAIDLPAQAAAGTWRLDLLRVPDRAGNGGWSGYSDYILNGTNQLCNRNAICVGSPAVTVDGVGDSEAPLLQSFSVTASGSAVTTSVRVTDAVSGTANIQLRYTSTETTQFQTCSMSRTAGTVNDGTWSCTINFPTLAATGSWVPTLDVYDSAANRRFYSRRSSDGFLCYFNPATSTTACANLGDTELILR